MRAGMHLAIVAVLALLVGCGGDEKKAKTKSGVETKTEKPATVEKRPDDADPKPRVELETTHGTIVLQLNRERAPITVKNFLRYVEDGFYRGKLFHRIMPGFIVQTGAYDKDMRRLKPGREPIKNESKGGLLNLRGTVAMARPKGPDSARAQFFVNLADNKKLNFPNASGHGYTVFGRVVEGMDVVEKIAEVETEVFSDGLPNCPTEDVLILGARRM